MNRKHRQQLSLILLLVPFLATSCIFFQKAEGDKHPDYPNILKRNDSLDLPLKPLAITNNFFPHNEYTDSKFHDEIPCSQRFEVDGRFIYMGSKEKLFYYSPAKTSLYYDNTGKLIKKSKRLPYINIYGQFFEKKDSVFYIYDFNTEKTVDTIQIVATINHDRDFDCDEGYHSLHKELQKGIPTFPPPPQREQYAHDTLFSKARYRYSEELPKMTETFIRNLYKSNEVYILSAPYNSFSNEHRYFILPQKKIAIAVSYYFSFPPDDLSRKYYVQTGELESRHLYASKDFQLKETESVVHSLYDCGGRGNFLLYQCERILYYYDFTAEGETLHFKCFRDLNLLEVTKVRNKYIITFGVFEGTKDLNYFFEYTPKAHRKTKKEL